MRKPTPILLSVTVLAIISLACGLTTIPVTGPTVGTLDPNALGTVIAQTMAAALTQTAGAAIPMDLVDSVSTDTPEPSLTPTATLSATPLYTATPLVPIVSVTTDTNCRTGPGKTYDRVGALMIGETAEVVARDPTGRYWYIKNPDQQNGYCWLWGEYATVSGNVAALPIFTPPPTPSPVPDFDAAYDGLESCSGWWVNLQLANNSGIAFRSIALTIKDLNTGESRSMYADKFTALEGCHTSATKDVLNPGERFTVSTPAFAYDPKGHKLRATITLCSAAGQNGTCVTKVFKLNI